MAVPDTPGTMKKCIASNTGAFGYDTGLPMPTRAKNGLRGLKEHSEGLPTVNRRSGSAFCRLECRLRKHATLNAMLPMLNGIIQKPTASLPMLREEREASGRKGEERRGKEMNGQ